MLQAHPAAVSILDRQKQALDRASEGAIAKLSSALEASQAEIGRQTQALNAAADAATQLQAAQSRLAILDAAAGTWQRTFADLQLSLDASKAELSRVHYHAEAKDAQIKTLQAEIDRQSQALQDAATRIQAKDASIEASQAEIGRQAQTIRETTAELQTSQTRIAALETAVATWQRTKLRPIRSGITFWSAPGNVARLHRSSIPIFMPRSIARPLDAQICSGTISLFPGSEASTFSFVRSEALSSRASRGLLARARTTY